MDTKLRGLGIGLVASAVAAAFLIKKKGSLLDALKKNYGGVATLLSRVSTHVTQYNKKVTKQDG